MQTFSVKESFVSARKLAQAKPALIALALIIMGAIFLSTKIMGFIEQSGLVGNGGLRVVSIAFALLNMAISISGIRIAIKAHDTPDSVTWRDLWARQPFGRYLVLSIIFFFLYAVVAAIVVGLGIFVFATTTGFGYGNAEVFALILFPVLFLVGLMIGTLLFSPILLSPFIVVDTTMGPIAALKESLRITKGSRFAFLGFIGRLVLLNCLGLLLAGLGLLITLPVSVLAVVHAYRMLSGTRTDGVEPVIVRPAPAL